MLGEQPLLLRKAAFVVVRQAVISRAVMPSAPLRITRTAKCDVRLTCINQLRRVQLRMLLRRVTFDLNGEGRCKMDVYCILFGSSPCDPRPTARRWASLCVPPRVLIVGSSLRFRI